MGQTKREVSVRVGEHRASVDRVIKKEKALAEEQEKEKQLGGNHRVLRSHKNKKAEQPTINTDDNNNQKNDSLSPITQHYNDTKHNFKWENFHILDKEPSYHKRNTSEVVHINTQKKSINLKEDSKGLFTPYLSVIYRMKKYNHFLFT